MKEKNKKIIKALGVGALTLIGGLTFAGCSGELTDSQMEKVMYAVESSDTFMKETIDLLEKQNEKLNKEEAYNLCQLAYEKIFLNYEGMRDNLTVKLYENDELFQTMISYSIEGDDVIISTTNGALDVLYEDGEKRYCYTNAGDTKTKEEIYDIHYSNNWYGLNIITQFGFTCDDIVTCESLDNGNYKVMFVKSIFENNEDDATLRDFILNVEISKTGEYVSIESYGSYQAFNEPYLSQSIGVMLFEYNSVDAEYVEECLAEAKAFQITPVVAE